jgi:chaperone required for assembly of F1-ATPase
VSQRGYKEPLAFPRRFYKAVEVAPAEGGFAVRLDGRTPRSPANRPLLLPTQALADLIAAEWDGQGEHILMATMPATRLAYTAIDRLGEAHADTAAEVARYAETDLLCYRAEGPGSLVERQEHSWGSLLAWAKDELGVALEVGQGIAHRSQPRRSVERVGELAEALDDFSLAALAHATGLLGSAVLALAVQRGRLSGEEAFGLSRLDEAFQEERWGIDAEAAERTERLAAEAVMLDRWFAALR